MAVKSASNKQPQGVPGHVQSFAWSVLTLGLLLTDRAKASTGLGKQDKQKLLQNYSLQSTGISDIEAEAAGEP